MSKIELIFYRTNPSEKNQGMKHVLWQITDPEGNNAYDWGFGFWEGNNWEAIEIPEGFAAVVHSWANTVDPILLLKEQTKIINIKGTI